MPDDLLDAPRIAEPNLSLQVVNGSPVLHRMLGGGGVLEAAPLLFGRGRVLVTWVALNERSVREDLWEFPSFEAAVAALATWDGRGEPAGWDRHPATGRRRPGGVDSPAPVDAGA